ncbi:MAG: hypothetical protein HXY40_07305 [Chloroflexi bacterium]|nr:hypothetical protein [Chloroflexota bacterium]
MRANWRTNLALMGCGVVMALGLLGLALLLFPQLRPDPNRQIVRFTVGIGDMFFNRPGLIAPPPNPNDILSEHVVRYDADGFRMPERAAERYDIIALGDSFTEATNAARPWPDVLVAASGLSVRNLGFRGYGPVQEARVLSEYGLRDNAATIVVGYFEGNDLSNVIDSTDYVEPRVARQQFAPFDPTQEIWRTQNAGPFPLPVRVSINGAITEMALLDDYWSWLNATVADFAQSANMRALEAVWRGMQAAVGDACLVIAYFPTAPHIYAPYIVAQDRAQMMATVRAMTISAPGAPLEYGGAIAYEEAITRLNNQRDALAALAQRLGLAFVDLVPAFQAAAARGEILYYAYDTHWNQAGHDLAGQAIAAYLAQNPCAR